jgi:hypothetical protein
MAKDHAGNGEQKDKSLHFFVPPEFHRRLKMTCAFEGKTLKAYFMGALQDALEVSERKIASHRADPSPEPKMP